MNEEEELKVRLNALIEQLCEKVEEKKEDVTDTKEDKCPCCHEKENCDEVEFENFLPYNVIEDDNKITFKVLVAGISQEDIKIEYKLGMIRITTAESKEEIKDSDPEYDFSNACTIINVPEKYYDCSKIETDLDKGILSIKVARNKNSIAREIKIGTSKKV